MNPLLKASLGAMIRAVMLGLGVHGVDIPGDDQSAVIDAIDTLVNAALVAVPLIWSIYQKYRTHVRIETAEMQVNLSTRRG